MNKVKIYTASPTDMSPPVDDKSFCVDFVLASDYAALQAERDQLAAENLALLNPQTWLQHSEEGEVAAAIADGNGASEQEALLAGMKAIIGSIETPATDRFLAEQRAQGVDNCAAVIQQQVWDEREGDGIVAALDAMEIYAAQLRNEVKG